MTTRRKRAVVAVPPLDPPKASKTAPESVQPPATPTVPRKPRGRPVWALNAEQARARELRKKEEALARRRWRRVFREVGVDSEVGAFFAAKAARLSIIEERLYRAMRRRGVVDRSGQVREGVDRLMNVLRTQLEIVRYVADPERGGWHLSSRRPEFPEELPDSTAPEADEENES